MDTHEGTVDADLLGGDGELERLSNRVAGCVRHPRRRVPRPERQKAELLRVCSHPHLRVGPCGQDKIALGVLIVPLQHMQFPTLGQEYVASSAVSVSCVSLAPSASTTYRSPGSWNMWLLDQTIWVASGDQLGDQSNAF